MQQPQLELSAENLEELNMEKKQVEDVKKQEGIAQKEDTAQKKISVQKKGEDINVDVEEAIVQKEEEKINDGLVGEIIQKEEKNTNDSTEEKIVQEEKEEIVQKEEEETNEKEGLEMNEMKGGEIANKDEKEINEQNQEDNNDEKKKETTTTKKSLKRKWLIIVTGFGIFAGHQIVNASWAAVNLLPDKLEHKGRCYTIEKMLVPVEYGKVDEAVKNIWARKPQLVIHCGVHGLATCVHVERKAFNKHFPRPDFAGLSLPNKVACLTKEKNKTKKKICSKLNVEKIVDVICENCTFPPQDELFVESMAWKKDGEETNIAKVSEDVGDYLCGYIYLKSLDIDCKRTLFIHVPPVNRPFSSSQTAEIIFKIIGECVNQIEEKKALCAR